MTVTKTKTATMTVTKTGTPEPDRIAGSGPIVAGVGFSSAADAGDICQAVRAALHKQNCDPRRLIALASIAAKKCSGPFKQAAEMLGVELVLIEMDAALAASKRGITCSQLSMDATGLPSVCEAAALAAVSRHNRHGFQGIHKSRLLAGRLCHGPVTCALAVSCDLSPSEQKPPHLNESIT